jgi:hypothetical protein
LRLIGKGKLGEGEESEMAFWIEWDLALWAPIFDPKPREKILLWNFALYLADLAAPFDFSRCGGATDGTGGCSGIF